MRALLNLPSSQSNRRRPTKLRPRLVFPANLLLSQRWLSSRSEVYSESAATRAEVLFTSSCALTFSTAQVSADLFFLFRKSALKTFSLLSVCSDSVLKCIDPFMVVPYFPCPLDFWNRGCGGGEESGAGRRPPPDSDPFTQTESERARTRQAQSFWHRACYCSQRYC